jgi:hypothetical protein
MPQANIFTLLSALISAVMGGVLVAVLNYWFTRKKTSAEIKLIEAQVEKIRHELRLNVDNISAAVTYKIGGSGERIIYDSTGRDLGFDFKGSKAQLWAQVDGVDRPVSDYGLGQISFENGVMNIQRSNTEGRYEVWLQSYSIDGQTLPSIPRNDLVSGHRDIRISFEAKAVGASHTLRILLKNEKANRWLGNDSRTVSGNFWTRIQVYFQIPPTDECRLRIDDLDVTDTPSSVQLRNIVVAERTS